MADCNDWRSFLFGPSISINDVSEATGTSHIKEVLCAEDYNYVAVFIGGQHCPYCRDFAPHVLKSFPALERDRRCKVIFMSADKSEENYKIMCKKLTGIPVLPYDPAKTTHVRELSNLKSIPALVIFRNRNFDDEEPELVTNARHMLVEDPTLDQLQWEKAQDNGAMNLNNGVSCGLNEAKKMQMALARAKQERLRNMDIFVLDNSLRETAVAAVKGQVASDKDQILSAVSKTGISDFIVAAFGELRRPEDVWLQEKFQLNQIQKSFWAFSEIADAGSADGPPTSMSTVGMPSGIGRCKEFGISNIIFEIDIAHWTNFKFNDFLNLFQTRLDAMRECSPDAKVIINLRDAPVAYFEENMSGKLKQIIKAAASTKPQLFGIAFEDPTAELLPWDIGILSAELRQCMEENCWDKGHLLVHVHKKYGLSDAAVIEALAMGCTGLWCAVCEEGGGMGHCCSLTTLVNLARLGNKNVAKKYNLSALHEATIKVTQITTGDKPHPRTEVYGSQAMDVVFPEGGMGSAGNHLCEILGCKENVRVSPFTNEDMMRQKLNSVFGVFEWEKFVLDFMIILIHLDLESGMSYEYQGPAGLLDLYMRAGGKDNTQAMNKVVVESFIAQQKSSSQLRDLRRKFDLCRNTIEDDITSPLNAWATGRNAEAEHDTKETFTMSTLLAVSKFKRSIVKKVLKTSDTLSYEEFYEGFLGPYHAHTNINPMENKVVTDTLKFIDSDGSGCIQWGELSSRALWVLENIPKEERARWSVKDILDSIFQNARLNGSRAHAIFLREHAQLIEDVCSRISRDANIQKLRKTHDSQVLKTFVTSLLIIGTMEFEQKKSEALATRMLMNIATLNFSEKDADIAFDLVADHVTNAAGSKTSFKFNRRVSKKYFDASFRMSSKLSEGSDFESMLNDVMEDMEEYKIDPELWNN